MDWNLRADVGFAALLSVTEIKLENLTAVYYSTEFHPPAHLGRTEEKSYGAGPIISFDKSTNHVKIVWVGSKVMATLVSVGISQDWFQDKLYSSQSYCDSQEAFCSSLAIFGRDSPQL